jgi:hypothetical protein
MRGTLDGPLLAALGLIVDGRRSTRFFGHPRFLAQPFNGADHQRNFPVGPLAPTRVLSCLGAPLVGFDFLTFTTGDASLNTPARVGSLRLKAMHGHRVANLE